MLGVELKRLFIGFLQPFFTHTECSELFLTLSSYISFKVGKVNHEIKYIKLQFLFLYFSFFHLLSLANT